MTNSGLRTIDYASGRTSLIEVAARRAIMTAVTQVMTKVTEHGKAAYGLCRSKLA